MPASQHKETHRPNKGRLRIGDNWNAITIIALSQNNPLKAIAEFVENSIDAKAKTVTIVRGKASNKHYLKIIDDGEGICRNENGVPDFKFVATHICDSIKRRLRKDGFNDIQGEFGIGLLSFWTVGEKLILLSAGTDGHTYQMEMAKGEPGYTIFQRRSLIPIQGTELIVTPLLPGLRLLNGEKIQRYLASELRDRIRKSDVKITVIDRFARAEYKVEPRQFSGQLLHQLPAATTPQGEIYIELYLNEPSPENQIGLHRSGTRVLPSLTQLDYFQNEPWTSGYFQGIIDAPFINLTPGTRDGIIQDENFSCLCEALQPISDKLTGVIVEQRKAEEERSSHQILRTVQKAFKEAFLILPQEEYDWFEIYPKGSGQHKPSSSQPLPAASSLEVFSAGGSLRESSAEDTLQKQFFEFAGPLHGVVISPATSVIPIKSSKNFRAIPRDSNRRLVEKNVTFSWKIVEGEGTLENKEREIVTFTAPSEPSLCRLQVTVRQEETVCTTEAVITVTDSILPETPHSANAKKGLPGYTLRRAPGEMWRSRYDTDQNVVVINNAHRDFVFASKNQTRKLRYICRLFTKELVYQNFPGLSSDHLLERMIELSLYTEENLK